MSLAFHAKGCTPLGPCVTAGATLSAANRKVGAQQKSLEAQVTRLRDELKMKQAMYIAEVQKVIGVNEVMDSMVATAERRLGPLANVQGGGGASALVAETLGELRAMNASCKQDEDVGILSEEQASERASERETERRRRARARARRM